jgi:hypothetical protein
MNRNSVLLSISAALLFSLYFVDGGFAFQIDRNQDARILMARQMNRTADLSIKQVSTAPNPCTEGGMGRTGAPGKQRCPLGSGAKAPAESRYISHVSNRPNPCGGRTGAPCKNQSPQGSGAMATDGSEYTLTTSASAAGTLFGVGLITLVVIGARRLRHPHGHHA